MYITQSQLFQKYLGKSTKISNRNLVGYQTKGSLSYRLCFEYFSQFKIDSKTYTYLAAVLKDGDVSKQVKLYFGNYFAQNRSKITCIEELFIIR